MFFKNKRALALVCLALILCFGVIAHVVFFPFPWEQPNPAIADGKTIRFGYIASDQLHNPAGMIMEEKKMLEAAGFTVEWVEYLGGAYAMQDMIEGSIDFAVCGVVPVMSAHARSGKMSVIAGANQEGASLVIDNTIKTVGDLNNKRVATPGIGSIQDTLLSCIEADYNIRIRHETMKVSDMPLFLQKGEINGFIAWAPHPAGAVELNYGHELLTSHDVMPNHQCCVLVTTKDNIQNDPETVEKLLEIYLEAYRWFLDNRDESIRMVAKATGMSSEAIVRNAINTVKYPFPPYCNLESIDSLAKVLIETDIITTVKAADMDSFIDSLYYPELMEKLSGR